MGESKLPKDEELRRLYVDKKLTMEAIAELFGVTRQRVEQRLRKIGIKRSKKKIDRATLEKLYVKDGLRAVRVAEKLGFSRNSIRRELIRHNIPLQSRKRFSFDRDFLFELYVTNGLLMREIAEKVGCGETTVAKELIRHGITERHPPAARRPPPFTREQLVSLHTDKGLTPKQIAENAGLVTTHVNYWLNRYGIAPKPGKVFICTEEALRRYYLDENKTVQEIATILGVSISAVYYALKRYGISVKWRRRADRFSVS